MEPRRLESGEIRVAIEAALTCGTDLKVFRRGYHARMLIPPTVFGHELAGIIAEVSKDLEGVWRIGDRVVAANSAPCGQCPFCQQNQENLCDDLLFLNGAYAESIVVPARLVARNLLRLKSETSCVDAALTEPLACVVQGVEDSQMKSGQRCLIIGAGPIGLMFVALAKNLGLNVTVAGRGQSRLQKARQLGAVRCIDVSAATDLARTVKEVDPVAFDVVIEAVGKPETWEASVQLVRKGGTVNFFGGCPAGTQVRLDTGLIHYSSLNLRASFHHSPRTIRRALEFIEAGVIRAADFVDGECPLSCLPELFKSMVAGNRTIKTLIRVRA
ncbi:MAG: zinc-binding dehydrogenase [Opitutaceae bacterium]|nr:zinc-binding dehydrogenase [Verrucomicrobiales bacterium]